MAASSDAPRSVHRRALLACLILLASFAAIAWLAARTKSPTYDEPYHAPAAWVALHWRDFRVDPQDPPLWYYWAALPNGRDALSADFSGENWTIIPRNFVRQWYWCVTTLYRTPGNDADRFINRSRGMMLVVGVALGATIAWSAWRLSGVIAAVVATGLFALDPNFLAHAALVKNDVAFSLAMLALAMALWRAGQRLTVLRAVMVGLLCAVMMTVKFSGVLAVALVPSALFIRALMRTPWPVLGVERKSRTARLRVAAGTCLLCGAIAVIGIWAVYGFRFDPTPAPGVRLNIDELADRAKGNEELIRGGGAPARAQPSAFVRAARFAEGHHLLPQAWLAGLLFTYQSALLRESFLGGNLSVTGWWYYFPFAMLVKTPVATLLVVGSAFVVLLIAFHGRLGRTPTPALPRSTGGGGQSAGDGRIWAAICLLVVPTIYMASAMRGNLNIGLRHVLPVYPFLFIAVGWAADAAVRRWERRAVILLVVLGVALAIESLSAFPHFIAFFNVAAGGARGGLHLLGDSNLDWGQDLKLLRDWQQRHPERPMYLAYFGLADPRYYGIDYTPLPGGYRYDTKPSWPRGVCVVAISATYLQGLMVDAELYQQFYKRFGELRPTEVLGGTIYLFEFPPMRTR